MGVNTALGAGLRERVARTLWYAHPARPGAQYEFLKKSQWWSREQIEELQVSALKRLMMIASNVSFYKEQFAHAGVGANDIWNIDDIQKLPILERSDVMRLGLDGMKVPGSRGMQARTSGSTGTPVRFLWPLEQMRWLDAGEARARAWMGSDVGTRRLEVRCRPVGRAQEINAVLLNTAAFHAPVVADRDEVRRLVRALQKNPPALIWGVSNALYVLAVALLEDGQTVRAGACWSGGNHLHAHYKRAFEQAFECKVYERYAAMETGLIAHECVEAGTMHVPAEGLIVEYVRPDGTHAAPREIADVVITSLHHTATPFIRYRIGDRAIAPNTSSCSCRRGLPRFGKVVGRAPDVLRTADGKTITPAEAVEAAKPGTNSIVDFQVAQTPDLRLRILVVQRDSSTAESDRDRIASVFTDRVRPPVKPLVERVDHIPLTPGGKLRTLIQVAE